MAVQGTWWSLSPHHQADHGIHSAAMAALHRDPGQLDEPSPGDTVPLPTLGWSEDTMWKIVFGSVQGTSHV